MRRSQWTRFALVMTATMFMLLSGSAALGRMDPGSGIDTESAYLPYTLADGAHWVRDLKAKSVAEVPTVNEQAALAIASNAVMRMQKLNATHGFSKAITPVLVGHEITAVGNGKSVKTLVYSDGAVKLVTVETPVSEMPRDAVAPFPSTADGRAIRTVESFLTINRTLNPGSTLPASRLYSTGDLVGFVTPEGVGFTVHVGADGHVALNAEW